MECNRILFSSEGERDFLRAILTEDEKSVARMYVHVAASIAQPQLVIIFIVLYIPPEVNPQILKMNIMQPQEQTKLTTREDK